MKRAISIVLVLLSTVALVAALSDPKPYYSLDFSVNGREYRFELFLKDLTRAPDWKIGDAEPPVSPNTAYLKAKAALDEAIPNLSDLRVSQVTITRVPGEDGQYHAYYEFSFFSTDIDSKPLGGPQAFYRVPVVVLMDGSVICPHRLDAHK